MPDVHVGAVAVLTIIAIAIALRRKKKELGGSIASAADRI